VDAVFASELPDLHEKFGAEFERAYLAYEAKVASGELKLFKKFRPPACGARC